MGLNFYNQNYDNCTIQGNCAQKPFVGFINEYIIKELKDIIFYIEKLKKMNFRNSALEKDIIALFAQLNLNFDFHGNNLINSIKEISEHKSNVLEFYCKSCKECNKYKRFPKDKFTAAKDITLNEIAKRGEELFLKRQEKLTPEASTLYNIYILLIKNMAKNLYEIHTHGYCMQEVTDKVFDSINKINIYKITTREFVKYIKDLYQTNFDITDKKYQIYAEKYGKISENKVKLSTRKNKCILVSGRTLKDLDDILENSKDKNVDIYTHNGMIFAYQYEKFATNKQLIGHFQKNAETMRYDFTTFPGPIVMGPFQQNKFEGVYRGNLFTTNQIAPFGVEIIKNNDYERVFNTAMMAPGFKKAHFKKKIKIGYDENKIDEILKNLNKDIKNGKYEAVMFFGLLNNDTDDLEFYRSIANNLAKKTFIFSLAEDIGLANSVHIDSCYDYNLALKIFKNLHKLKQEKDFEINVYIADCNSYITTNLMMLNFFGVKNIFIRECKKLPNTDCLKSLLDEHFNTHITKHKVNEDIKILNLSV